MKRFAILFALVFLVSCDRLTSRDTFERERVCLEIGRRYNAEQVRAVGGDVKNFEGRYLYRDGRCYAFGGIVLTGTLRVWLADTLSNRSIAVYDAGLMKPEERVKFEQKAKAIFGDNYPIP
jgi:hypothetical protein